MNMSVCMGAAMKLIVIVVIIAVGEFSVEDVVLELNDGLAIGVEPFDASRQPPTGGQVEMLEGVAGL